MIIDLEQVISGYMGTLLWSSIDEHGTPMDDLVDEDDFDSSALEEIRKDVTDFCSYASEELEAIPEGEQTSSHIGHDFCLTRNRHGAGFWDGDYPNDLGQKLTEKSHHAGSMDVYIGDDGKVYVS